MRRFIIKIAIFFVLMFVVDRAMGYAFCYFVENAKGGYVRHHQYMSNEMKCDVLIFGSSRAVHHYDAKMIEDSLGMSCYNCGQDGNGAVFNEGQWRLIKQRYQPKLIIYDITPEFDLIKGDNHKYLGWLKLYYDKAGIPEVFDKVDRTERVKMMSQMYRYNYNPIQFFADYIHPILQLDNYGFMPLKGELDTMKINKNYRIDKEIITDIKKIESLNYIIHNRGNAKIVFVVSPIWYGIGESSLRPIKDLCKKEGILFWDFANNPNYVHQNQFFKDGSHMNSKGAAHYTKELINKLKEI